VIAAALARAPNQRPEHLTRTQTPWGELEHAAPLAEYSETRAYWDAPVLPLGASKPAW
jgi:hypothetical protein